MTTSELLVLTGKIQMPVFGALFSKRWLVSLALVAMVSLFMASYGAVWTDTASAGSTGGTLVYSADKTLGGVVTLNYTAEETQIGPASDQLLGAGKTIRVDFAAKNQNNEYVDDMPDVTIVVTTNDSCVTVSDRKDWGISHVAFNLTASSTVACSTTVTVTMEQDNNGSPFSDSFVVVSRLPDPNATSSTTAIDPATVSDFSGTIKPPTGVDSTAVKTITPKNGGTLSVPVAGGSVSLEVPGGGVGDGEGAQVSIKSVDPANLPAPNKAATEGSSSGTFKFGKSVVQITWYDADGNAADTKTLNRTAKVCMTATKAEADEAYGGPEGLGIWRHNGTTWVKLNSTVTLDGDIYTVCANSSKFSPFVVGLDVAPPETDTSVVTGLPVTGDYAPGANGLVVAMMAGIALVFTGAFTIRRSRRARENS